MSICSFLSAPFSFCNSPPHTAFTRACFLLPSLRLALCSLGWDVLATDLPDVISSVLSANISHNLSNLPPACGSVHVRILNWTIPPDEWTWDNRLYIAASAEDHMGLPPQPSSQCEERLLPPFDMILSADTLYEPSLVEPLLRTLHHLSTLSLNSAKRPPPVYLCVERRDPGLMDQALALARDTWNFTVERVPRKKITKAMEKGGLVWEPEEWDDVEIWKLNLRNTT